MKKAEDYLNKINFPETEGFGCATFKYAKELEYSVLLNIIKKSQIDAINEAVELCAKNASVINNLHNNGTNTIPYEVDKDSILDCAKILIDKL